jgi:hypothetical protein
LRGRDVRQRLDNAARSLDAADFVHGVTRDGLLERLRPMTVDAAVVVDLGAATGSAVPLLQGSRSLLAAESLIQRGYRFVYNLEGGLAAWRRAFPA